MLNTVHWSWLAQRDLQLVFPRPEFRQYWACIPGPILGKGQLQNLLFHLAYTLDLPAYVNSMLAVWALPLFYGEKLICGPAFTRLNSRRIIREHEIQAHGQMIDLTTIRNTNLNSAHFSLEHTWCRPSTFGASLSNLPVVRSTSVSLTGGSCRRLYDLPFPLLPILSAFIFHRVPVFQWKIIHSCHVHYLRCHNLFMTCFRHFHAGLGDVNIPQYDNITGESIRKPCGVLGALWCSLHHCS